MKAKVIFTGVAAIAILCYGLLVPRLAGAHCDTMDGPVVMAAKKALEKGEVASVLKWVKKVYEKEILAAFNKTLVVRSKGPEAKELADLYFFETVVRLHRAGEGAPYTGLKPAGSEIEPAVVAADEALASGSAENLVKLVVDEMAEGIRLRFVHATETKKHAEESVEAGREFVEAYVEFVHYVERLHLDAKGHTIHHDESNGAKEEGQRPH